MQKYVRINEKNVKDEFVPIYTCKLFELKLHIYAVIVHSRLTCFFLRSEFNYQSKGNCVVEFCMGIAIKKNVSGPFDTSINIDECILNIKFYCKIDCLALMFTVGGICRELHTLPQ